MLQPAFTHPLLYSPQLTGLGWPFDKLSRMAWAVFGRCLRWLKPLGPVAPSFCLEYAMWCLEVEKPSSHWENESHTLWDRELRHEKSKVSWSWSIMALDCLHLDFLLLEINIPSVGSLALLIHKCLTLTLRWFSSQISFFKLLSYPCVSITSWPLCGILLFIHLYCC